MEDGITFQAIFKKASTTIDGGWLVSFEVNQSEAQQLMILAEMRDINLQLAVVPIV